MGPPIAARRRYHAHIQGIRQRLLRQIPQTGRQQAIRTIQPVQRDRAAPAQQGVRRHTARPHHQTDGRRMVRERQGRADGLDVRAGRAHAQTDHARRSDRAERRDAAAHPGEPVPVPRHQTAIQATGPAAHHRRRDQKAGRPVPRLLPAHPLAPSW